MYIHWMRSSDSIVCFIFILNTFLSFAIDEGHLDTSNRIERTEKPDYIERLFYLYSGIHRDRVTTRLHFQLVPVLLTNEGKLRRG